MLVTRYDGVWIIVLAFNESPVIADVDCQSWTQGAGIVDDA